MPGKFLFMSITVTASSSSCLAGSARFTRFCFLAVIHASLDVITTTIQYHMWIRKGLLEVVVAVAAKNRQQKE